MNRIIPFFLGSSFGQNKAQQQYNPNMYPGPYQPMPYQPMPNSPIIGEYPPYYPPFQPYVRR